VRDAWALFPAGRTPGDGVVVGHPDTGYTDHAEIASRLRPDLGFDFVDEDDDPTDPLAGGFLANPGHGTGTSSVIVSPPGRQLSPMEAPFVSGVAPGASLIPIRTAKSVVLFSMSGLTRAIRFAITRKVHVVSISLGGPFGSTALHNAIRDAEQAGIIVCCAAGNQVRFVVFPAAYDEVVAVAANRIDDDTWSGSCRGPSVDITAPGSSVWRARTERHGRTMTRDVTRGSGTSFAVAHIAGLASLWQSLHGRATLVEKYGAARLAGVFKQLLQSTCRTPPDWDTKDFGPGIAHAARLLAAPLPAIAPARGMRGVQRRAVSHGTNLDVIVHQLAPAPRSGVARVLADLLAVDEERLPDVLDEVGQELAMNIGLDAALRASLQAAAAPAAAAAMRGARRRAPAARTLVRWRVRRLTLSRRLAKRLG
jgi:thermitase